MIRMTIRRKRFEFPDVDAMDRSADKHEQMAQDWADTPFTDIHDETVAMAAAIRRAARWVRSLGEAPDNLEELEAAAAIYDRG